MDNQVVISHPKNWGFDEKLILGLAKNELLKRGFKENVLVGINFVGRDKAKALNIKFRNKRYIPQVLGFPLSKDKDVDGIIRLGDIVICSQKAKYEAKFLKQTEEEILESWIGHGIDNLLK